MVILKMMGPEDVPDNDPRKTFRLISGLKSVYFERRVDDGSAIATITHENGDAFCVNIHGNAYLMNEHGKTVATFGPAKPPKS